MTWSKTNNYTIWFSPSLDKQTSAFTWLLHSFHAIAFCKRIALVWEFICSIMSEKEKQSTASTSVPKENKNKKNHHLKARKTKNSGSNWVVFVLSHRLWQCAFPKGAWPRADSWGGVRHCDCVYVLPIRYSSFKVLNMKAWGGSIRGTVVSRPNMFLINTLIPERLEFLFVLRRAIF